MIEIINSGDCFQIHDISYWRIVKKDTFDYKLLISANSLKEFYEKEIENKHYSFCLNHYIHSYSLFQDEIIPLFVLDMFACHNSHIIYKILAKHYIEFLLIDQKWLQESIILL